MNKLRNGSDDGRRSPVSGRRLFAGGGVAFALIVTLALAPGLTEGEPREAAIDRLAWLSGCWEGTLSNGAVYEEVWLAPRGADLLGIARMSRDGRTLSFEFMRIAEEDGVLVYSAQPSGRPPTHFRAGNVTADEVTFENPEHDFPQRIRYRHTPPDGLHARIEGERNGQERGIDFPLGRAACPGA